MKNSVNFFSFKNIQLFFIVLIPITLFISIKLNSIIIIILLLLTIKDVITNRKTGVVNNTKLFIPPLLFVLSVLIGFFIDYYYGFNSVKTIERLLPFVVLPFIFFLGIKKKFKTFRIILIFSYLITIVNLLLIVFSTTVSIRNMFSNQFISDSWMKYGTEIIVSDNELSPNGKKNVIKLVESLNEGSHDLIYKLDEKVIPDKSYIRSVFIKKAEKDWVFIRQYDGISHKGIWFNISKGFVGKTEEGLIGKIESYKNGWFRCSVINKTDEKASTERIQITLVNGNGNYKYKGDGVSGLFIWGAEIGLGETNKSYLPSEYNFKYNQFFRENLLGPLDIHPTYYSVYIITAIVFFILLLFSKFKPIYILIILFNIIILLLISSKAALLSFLIILGFLSLIYFKKSKKHFLFLLAFVVIIMTAIFTIPKIKLRVEQSIETVLNNRNEKLSTYKRLLILKEVLSFNNKDLAFGKGNIFGEQVLKEKTGLNLNAHNQYFQALISSGLLGLAFLLVYLLSPLYYFNNFKDWLSIFTICLVILFSVNFLFESMLNRQWGIVFVAYFYSLLKKDIA